MKKGLIGIAVLLVVALATVLVAPPFIDWTRYKDDIAGWVERRTGRDLTIDGALSLSLLPAPTLRATDVAFANAPRGTAEHLLRMEALDVRVALVPLLGGRIQVESVRLVRPVVVLETLPGGGGNWRLEPPASAAEEGRTGSGVGGAIPGAARDEPGEGLAVALESVVVDDGSILWRSAGGAETRIEQITAEVAADSLRGPFAGTAEMTVNGARLVAETRLGRLAAGQDTFLSTVLRLPAAAAEATIQGRVGGLAGGAAEPRFAGSLTASGSSLAGALAAANGPEAAAPALGKPFRLAGDLTVAPAAASLEDLTLRLGETEGTGGVFVAYGTDAAPRVEAALTFARLDLDSLLREARATPGSATPSGGRVIPAAVEAPAVPGTRADADAGLPELPEDLTGTLDVAADIVTWRGGLIRDAALRASLSGGEVTLSRASALLPGSSEINVFGFVDLHATPARLDGTMEVKSSNLRDLLGWLGADVPAVPADRLRRFAATAAVQGTAADVTVPSLEGTLDLTRFTGAAALRVTGERPAFGVSLSVDTLNLDAYAPAATSEAAPPAGAGGEAGGAADGDQAAPPPPLFADLGVLNTFDAQVKARAGLLTWRDTEIRDARLDVRLVQGTATFSDTGAEAVAGATVSMSGGLSGFGGEPAFDALTLGLSTDEPGRVARLFDFDLPVDDPQTLAPVGLSVTLNGTPDSLALSAAGRAAGAAVTAAGTVRDVVTAPVYALDVTAEHEAVVELLRRLGIAYEPRGGRGLGPLSMSARAEGTAGRITLPELSLRLGPSTFTGSLAVALDGARPSVDGDLAVDTLPLDAFLPAERAAALERAVGGIIPAAFPVVPRTAPGLAATAAQTAGGRWSTEPIDVSALRALDATVALTAGSLSYEAWRLTDADLSAALADGRLEVPSLTGVLFGGPLTLSAAASPAAGGGLTLAVDTRAEGVDLGAALQELSGTRAARGRMALALDVRTTGDSERALVAGLDGTGRLALSKVDMRRAEDLGGTALAAVLAPLRALDRLGGIMGGESYGVDVAGDFGITRGIAATKGPLTIRSNLYDGSLQGSADLPAWTVDAEGQVRLSRNLLTELLASQVKLPDVVPVALSGPLDSPDVRIGTARQSPEAAPEAQPAAPEDQARDAVRRLLQEELGMGGSGAQNGGGDGDGKPEPEEVLRESLKDLFLGR